MTTDANAFDDEQCLVVHSGPDDLGRCGYTLFWKTDYIPGLPEGRIYWKAQEFFAIPDPIIPKVSAPPAGWGKLDKHGNICQ